MTMHSLNSIYFLIKIKCLIILKNSKTMNKTQKNITMYIQRANLLTYKYFNSF